MRSFLFIGAASIIAVSASPAPQAFDPNKLNNVPVTITQGPPVGPGKAQETRYLQSQAQATAAAVVSGAATAQQAKRDVLATPVQVQRAAVTARDVADASSTNFAPTTCTPTDWTNTYAFTSTTACPTAIEVGTYCGFINPLDPCAAQPNAYGPPTVPDDVEHFKSNPTYSAMAKTAKTPAGWDQSFQNLNGATEGSGYLAYKVLTSYNVSECAAYCDSSSTCTGFNIYIERDPKWNPYKCSCPNPPSLANYKCSIWGQDVTNSTATNVGQNRDGFEVVIVASNGYNRKPAAPPTPPNCSNPQSCGKKLHNQQPYCMGEKTFPGPYDPSLCAAYAQKQNQVNRQSGLIGLFMSLLSGNTGGCVQFQASYLEKNGKGYGTNCRLFTKKFQPSQAILDISNGGTSNWGCQKSYTFDVDPNANFNWAGKWRS